MTTAEETLWRELRGRRLANLKFRRQRPLGPCVVDFCCLEARLVVEVDGTVHDEQVEQDAERTRYLEGYGFQVLRFRNDEVLADLHAVLTRIAAEATRVGHASDPFPPDRP